MRCKKCGKKLRTNETFCTVCGYFNDPEDDTDFEEWETADYDDDVKEVKELDDDDAIELEEYDEEEMIEDDEKVLEDDDDAEDFFNDKEDIIEIVDEEEINKKESKKKKNKKEKVSYEEKVFYYEDEDILEAYIGEDYKIIKRKPFNIYAFLLSWIYVLYRKLYITGIFGLFLTGLIIVKFPKVLIIAIYAIASMIFWGFFFNKYYIRIARWRVKYIKNRADSTDRFKIINVSAEKGGAKFLPVLIIYLVFLIILLIILLNVRYNKDHDKFWKENSENQANCVKVTKTAAKDLITEQEKADKIVEATCKVNVSGKKEYSVYLKTKDDIYFYYQTEDKLLYYKNTTEDIENFVERQDSGLLTEEEKDLLKEKQSIKYTYTNIYNKAIEEDKLIEKKKNKSQKLNYFFSEEEINR